MYDLGSKIYYYRRLFRFSQSKLAKMLNVSQTLISQWEHNSCEPNIETLRQLCFIFDISSDELLEIDTIMQNLSDDDNSLVILFYE